jgi:hypothetical protein
VHWLGRSATDTSWEQLEEFKIRYPKVQLTDELFVGEEVKLSTLSWARNTSGASIILPRKGRPPKVVRNQPQEDK